MDDQTGGDLKRMRRELGLTQQQLAEKLGVTRKTVHRMESTLVLQPMVALAIEALRRAA